MFAAFVPENDANLDDPCLFEIVNSVFKNRLICNWNKLFGTGVGDVTETRTCSAGK
jgi:hypothetical protein